MQRAFLHSTRRIFQRGSRHQFSSQAQVGSQLGRSSIVIAAATAAAIFAFGTSIVLADSASSSKPSNLASSENPFSNFIPPNRSGPVLPNDKLGPVWRVVGDTAESILLDPSTSVILKVFASDCHNCRNLGFVFEVIAEEFTRAASELGLDPIIFAEMDGQENYVRGLIDFANEGRFPHVIALPAGKEKFKTFQYARNKTQQIAKYYNPLLREEVAEAIMKRQNSATASKKSTTSAQDESDVRVKTSADGAESLRMPESVKPAFTRSQIPTVGTPWTMKWGPGRTITDALIDFIAQECVAKSGVDAEEGEKLVNEVKSRVQQRLPELKNQVLEAAKNEYMENYDKVTCADPCGALLEEAYKGFYTASMGLSDPVSSTVSMAQYRECVWSKEDKVKEYYLNIKKHIDFIEDCYKDKDGWLQQDKQMREYYANIKPE